MGKPVNLKSIAMSCNLEDPWQKELYDYVKGKSNSSWYLKTLALMDMKGELGYKKPHVIDNSLEVSDIHSVI